jgi:dTDP-4-amino-4,6-dideoxygalactose transaminase
MKIPMSSPVLDSEDIEAVQEVLETRYLSLGPKTKAFESAISDYVGARFGVAVNSGTSGLHLAVIAAEIGPGDLVITTPFSFIASSNCILFEGAIPVFVDIDPVTYNIDPVQVQQAAIDLSAGGEAADRWLPKKLKGRAKEIKELKAILTVDAFGQPADYDPIQKTADEFDLKIIEDSCESLGATYKDRYAGTLGDMGVFAFYPNKQMTTGEGGMLVTDNEEWALLYRSLRNQGRDVFDAWLTHTRLGYNYRMDEMSAALGLSQFHRIEELLERRARVASWYNELLIDIPEIRIPQIAPETTRMSWFVYVIKFDSRKTRDRIMKDLFLLSIPTRPYFTPIHLQPFYMNKFGYKKGDYPETERAGDCCLALPFSGVMTEDQVEHVASAIKGIL